MKHVLVSFKFLLLILLFTFETLKADEDEKKLGHIIGGTFASKDMYPWFTMLLSIQGDLEQTHDCGGSLVSPEWVLTAAHCIEGNTIKNNGAVRVGAFHKPFKSGDNGEQHVEFFKLKSITTHPFYNQESLDKDFALLRLDGISTITPVPLDSDKLSDSYTAGRSNLWTVGLGTTDVYNYNAPDNLKHAEVDYVFNSECSINYEEITQLLVTKSMMCAARDGNDSCKGDSGGPLYDAINKTLVGVVSWGNGCAFIDYPGVYSRISSEYNWIKTTICENSDSPPLWCDYSPVSSPVELPTQSTNSPVSSPVELPTQSTNSPVSSPVELPTQSTNSPVSSPVELPTQSTNSPVSSPVELPTQSTCEDSPLKFKVKGMRGLRTCSWAKPNPITRCTKGVSEACPLTCGSCSICADAPLRFKIHTNDGRLRSKKCIWATRNRCENFPGIAATCRKKCDICT